MSTDSYKNPFADYNANVMDVSEILDWWCDPFQTLGDFAGYTASDLFTEKMPIIFFGGRGSGKTMFLRYWSSDVQIKKLEQDGLSIEDGIIEAGGIGAYVRIDGPTLRSFQNSGVSDDDWAAIFGHYLELVVTRECIQSLAYFVRSADLEATEGLHSFWTATSKLLGVKDPDGTSSCVLDRLDSLIEEVTTFRESIPFKLRRFDPSRPLATNSMVPRIPALLRKHVLANWAKINLVVLLDEYENFSARQQRTVNTLLKFHKDHVVYRVGMRLEGFRTYATVTKDDFIKEGRDYQKAVFDDFLNRKRTGFTEYLLEIARKRLRSISHLEKNGLTDIRKFLGKRESLEKEALTLASDRSKKMFRRFEKHLPKGAYRSLHTTNKPLLDMMAVLYVLRGESVASVRRAIAEYSAGEKTKAANRIRYDLSNKYKLSLVILLASIYRQKKSYYSFNTFAFLSSGIVGHFLEMCRLSFRHAEFEDREGLLEGRISPAIQSKAAREFATRELQQVKRIEDHGTKLYQMAINLGNIFREYHSDPFVRYPEMNQFSLDMLELEPPYDVAFRSAIKWSVIQRKNALQSGSPGSGRTEIFTLSRAFSPVFELTYRTRGGINEQFDAKDMLALMTTKNVKPKRDLSARLDETKAREQQGKLGL